MWCWNTCHLQLSNSTKHSNTAGSCKKRIPTFTLFHFLSSKACVLICMHISFVNCVPFYHHTAHLFIMDAATNPLGESLMSKHRPHQSTNNRSILRAFSCCSGKRFGGSDQSPSSLFPSFFIFFGGVVRCLSCYVNFCREKQWRTTVRRRGESLYMAICPGQSWKKLDLWVC